VLRNNPTPGQPLIPLSASTGIARNALRERRKQRWQATKRLKRGLQHLSRIKPSFSNSLAFFVGTRADQKILAKLRLGHSTLGASASRFLNDVDETCECGDEPETVAHFLLRCPLRVAERESMIEAVKSVYHDVITEEVLLGGSAVRLKEHVWSTIVRAVATFVRATRRNL